MSGGDGGGGGGGMRTVECLRGRLLAERVASKAAKEEADQLSKRVHILSHHLQHIPYCSILLAHVLIELFFSVDFMVGLGHSWTS